MKCDLDPLKSILTYTLLPCLNCAYILTSQWLKCLLISIAKRGGSMGERAGVIVTADGAVALDRGEATRATERVLGVVGRALLHLVVCLQHEVALH